MYDPHPIELNPERLPEELRPAMERIAEAVHDTWAAGRIAARWKYGPHRDDEARTHPCLRLYNELPESEKYFDRRTAAQTIQSLLDMGYRLEKQPLEE